MIDSPSLERVLVDSNVVIYAYDPADAKKHDTARDLLKSLSNAGRLVFTTQVLNEFSSIVMRPNRTPRLSPDETLDRVRNLVATGDVLQLTANTTLQVLSGVTRHRLSFWDALIWASAKEHGVSIIYTEDMPSAPVIDGVRYINPFAA